MQQQHLNPTAMSLEQNLAALSVEHIEQAYTIRVYNSVRVINGRIHTGYHELEFADKESDDQIDNQRVLGPCKEDHIRKRRAAALSKARDEARKRRFDQQGYYSDSDGEEPEELSETEKARQADPVWFERVKKNTESYVAKQAAIAHQRTMAN